DGSETLPPTLPRRPRILRRQLGKRGTAADRIQGGLICPDAVTPERRPLRGRRQVERLAEQLHGPLLILRTQLQVLPVPLRNVRLELAGGLGVDPRRVPQQARTLRPQTQRRFRIDHGLPVLAAPHAGIATAVVGIAALLVEPDRLLKVR